MAVGHRYKKGNPGGPGRPSKKKDRITIDKIRKSWHPINYILGELGQIEDALERCKVVLELVPYFEPKKREIEFSLTKAHFGTTDLSTLEDSQIEALLPQALGKFGYETRRIEAADVKPETAEVQ